MRLVAALLVVAVAGCLQGAQGPDAPAPEPGWDPVALTGMDHTYEPEGDHRDGTPYGVHLSFAGDPQTSLTVTWFTYADGDVEPVVEWGTAADAMDQTVQAATEKAYSGDPSRDEPLSDAYTHSATITGLEPGQHIWYRVNGTTGMRGPWQAHTDPGPGHAVRILHWGDQGVVHDATKNTTGLALELDADLIVIAGDVAYADGNQTIWDRYFWTFEPLFARVPLMPSSGNHESNDGPYFDGFRTRFTLPGDELWYAFDYGDVHFTVMEMDLQTFYQPGVRLVEQDPDGAVESREHGARMMRFFEEDLAATYARKEAGETVWHAVLQHFPLYSNHEARGNDCIRIPMQEPLMQRYDVDLLLVGHNHHYERSHPMAYGERHEDGFVEFINGAGGRGLYPFAPPGEFQPWSAAWAHRHAVTVYDVNGTSWSGATYATDTPLEYRLAGELEVLDTFTLAYGIDVATAPAAQGAGFCAR